MTEAQPESCKIDVSEKTNSTNCESQQEREAFEQYVLGLRETFRRLLKIDNVNLRQFEEEGNKSKGNLQQQKDDKSMLICPLCKDVPKSGNTLV